MQVKVHAPGKLILSGEHAVVYGKPALAMAVNRYVVATATRQLLPLVSFNLSDLKYENGFTLNTLHRLKSRIKRKYQKFITGDFKIRDVLHKPVELAQFAFTIFLESLNIKLTHGVRIHLQSDIPIGCGMGSSAATILSIVHAVAHHLGMDLSEESIFEMGLKAENMQHGYSSGLDLRVSLHGGCILVDKGEIHTRPIPDLPMYLVNTGTPESGTGECVTHAASYFKSSTIAEDFASVTYSLDRALQTNHFNDAKCAIQQNHTLLTHIGVVPHRVQQFISGIEKAEGAAKICGAGAIAGDKAGIVLVITENADALESLCQQYQYSILPITGESRGVHVV